ncbi:MAG: hypothetical protein WC497_03290 [Patescibacteria group bacterium]
MLILTRRPGEKIFIDRRKPRPGLRNLWHLFGRGRQERVATIVLQELRPGEAGIGIIADPRHYLVNREEIDGRIKREGLRRNGPGGTPGGPRPARRPGPTAVASIIHALLRRRPFRFQSVSYP